jgi:hypothetical protein
MHKGENLFHRAFWTIGDAHIVDKNHRANTHHHTNNANGHIGPRPNYLDPVYGQQRVPSFQCNIPTKDQIEAFPHRTNEYPSDAKY